MSYRRALHPPKGSWGVFLGRAALGIWAAIASAGVAIVLGLDLKDTLDGIGTLERTIRGSVGIGLWVATAGSVVGFFAGLKAAERQKAPRPPG
jgi:hypothetical protein